MTLIVKHDDGRVQEIADVLDFDYIDKEYVENVAEGAYHETLTDEQVQAISKAFENYEEYPNVQDIYYEVRQVLGMYDGEEE